MLTTTERAPPIAMVGFGEAAQAFLSGWERAALSGVTAYDIKTHDPRLAGEMEARYRAHAVAGKPTVAAALRAAELVFSLVTADQSLAAARGAAGHLRPGALWFDGNSCSPQTKREAAAIIEAAGGSYVDVAVMAPVRPLLHRTPLLIAGREAARAEASLLRLGMCPEVAGERVGDASAIKMIRSVVVKGIEALTAECLLAARRAGVEEAVLRSLEKSHPDTPWRARSAYNLERMVAHGKRRAAEMREVAATLDALGIPSRMARATAEWQDEIGERGLGGATPVKAQRGAE